MRRGSSFGLDGHLDVAEGPEPQGLEPAVVATTGAEHVLHPEGVLALDLVAVPLLALGVLQGLGVGQGHGAAGSSARLQNGVGVREVNVVEQDRGPRPGRHHQVPGTLEEPVSSRDSLGPPHGGDADRFLLHGRDGPGHELPQHAFARDRRAAGLRALGAPALGDHRSRPRLVREARLLPAPRIATAVHGLPGRGRVVAAGGRSADGKRLVPRVPEHLPAGPGIGDGLALGVALHEESAVAAELRRGPLLAPVPNERREHVLPRLEVGRQIHRLVPPVHEVRALRPRRHLLAVHEQPVAVVGRDVDGEMLGPRRQVERPAEVKDAVRIAGRVGRCDPARRDRPPEDPGGLELGFTFGRPRGQRSRGRSQLSIRGASRSCSPPSGLARTQPNSASVAPSHHEPVNSAHLGSNLVQPQVRDVVELPILDRHVRGTVSECETRSPCFWRLAASRVARRVRPPSPHPLRDRWRGRKRAEG